MAIRPYKLSIVSSHPIQYQAPLFRALAAQPEIDLEVLFCSQWGMTDYHDPGFDTTFSWDIPLLEGYRYRFLRNIGIRSGHSTMLSIINPGIISTISRSRVDAILVSGWALLTNWLTATVGPLRDVPLLLRGEANGLSEPTGLKGLARRTFIKMFLSRISGFLAIGSKNRDFYVSMGVPSEKIFPAPYAVDNNYFLGEAQKLGGKKHSLRKEKGLDPELPVILYCGKYQEKKRPMDLLQSFTSLPTNIRAQLVFLGDGPQRADLQKFIEDHNLRNVTLTGFRNQTDLPAYYALADVLVLPSRFEPWGLVVNEAMCFGLPIIATESVGAAADLIKAGENGYVFKTGDVETLTGKLAELIANKPLRERMGEVSLGIISHWGIAEDVKGIMAALESVGQAREPARN